jgi:hypothetical protein
VTNRSEPVICCSVRAKSSLPHTPIVGQATGGRELRAAGSLVTKVAGSMLARYQLSPAVSAPGRDRSATCRSHSGSSPGPIPFQAQRRNTAQSSADSTRSATPGNWNHSMYQDRCFWAMPAAANDTGWPTETATSLLTRSGAKVATIQASPAPQSCPTTAARSTPSASSRATTSPTRVRIL